MIELLKKQARKSGRPTIKIRMANLPAAKAIRIIPVSPA
jgi:hypothetical protein